MSQQIHLSASPRIGFSASAAIPSCAGRVSSSEDLAQVDSQVEEARSCQVVVEALHPILEVAGEVLSSYRRAIRRLLNRG